MRNIWMRLGVTLHITEEEEALILGEDSDDAEEAIETVIREGRYNADGNSYIPDTAITEYNEEYYTEYDDDGDIEIDLYLDCPVHLEGGE